MPILWNLILENIAKKSRANHHKNVIKNSRHYAGKYQMNWDKKLYSSRLKALIFISVYKINDYIIYKQNIVKNWKPSLNKNVNRFKLQHPNENFQDIIIVFFIKI